MIGIDTNILVRFITLDDEQQNRVAQDLIFKYKGKPESIYIDNIVICELCWLLKTGYKYDNEQIYQVIRLIQTIEEFKISDKEVLNQAIVSFQDHMGDFADYLILYMSKKSGCKNIYSFDQKMIKNNYFKYPGNPK